MPDQLDPNAALFDTANGYAHGMNRKRDGSFLPSATKPRNVIVILLDSLNRHMLGAYGSNEFETPHLDRFAERSLRFQNHHAGSLPCMPARHDILCGSLDFLWRPWGSVEVWEQAIPRLCTQKGIVTQLITDHPHLFETGGENYHVDFTAWDYERGSETDPWRTIPDPSAFGAPTLPAIAPGPLLMNYDRSRTYFREEPDFPGPRTMTATAKWIRENANQHERFFLFVDEFDPHEPFDTPEPWASMYDDTWEGPRLIWPPYITEALKSGKLTERQALQLRANYGAKISMIDHWFGKVIDALDETGTWDDTAIIVVSDHGHYLGEHDLFGKPPAPIFRTLGNIPLFVAWPGVQPGEIDALTTSVDLFATLVDIFDVEPEQESHGKSLVPLIVGSQPEVREYLLSGVWGREVHVIGNDVKYVAAPDGANFPLEMWSNRWSTLPYRAIQGFPSLPAPDSRATLDYMPGATTPVIRQPYQPGDMLPYWAAGPFTGDHLYLLKDDPDELSNRIGGHLESEARDLLRSALEEVDAPKVQFARLGLA
jgi:arylsulfatase A-like enzyme